MNIAGARPEPLDNQRCMFREFRKSAVSRSETMDVRGGTCAASRYESRLRNSSYPKRFTQSSVSVSLSHSQIDGSGTPLNVLVFTIE